VIFARSNRPTVTFGATSLAVAVTLLAWAAVLAVAGYRLAGLVLGMLATVALAVVARTALRLQRWPLGRIGLFRDRLVLIQGRMELQAPWDLVETATLADQGDWSAGRWPALALTDRLTIWLRPARRFSFRPATFGLDPGACRDLVLRLRDEPTLRLRLPEFDSILDLSILPLQTGQLIHPQL
jgi:hypothetical protein